MLFFLFVQIKLFTLSPSEFLGVVSAATVIFIQRCALKIYSIGNFGKSTSLEDEKGKSSSTIQNYEEVLRVEIGQSRLALQTEGFGLI
jgi:hypothetical protein